MPWIDCVKGVIEGYLAGQNVGYANRAVLYGEVNPCGRLPETLPEHLGDTPCYLTYGGEGNRAEYTEHGHDALYAPAPLRFLRQYDASRFGTTARSNEHRQKRIIGYAARGMHLHENVHLHTLVFHEH